MPSKQELMEIMDNRLPGETLAIRSSPVPHPPAYPDLETLPYTSPQHMEQPQQPQQHQQAAPVYTLEQPTPTTPTTHFGARSHLAYCPSCHATQMTRCDYESSMMTHIVAAILCLSTCCCCLPYFFDNCKSAHHYCQNCGSYLGSHNK